MTDNKFTDDEIIKALECCKNPIPMCDDCPIGSGGMCFDFLKMYALNLIKRRNEEIERITLEYAGFKAGVNHFADIGKMYSEIRSEAIKEFADRFKERCGKNCDSAIIWAKTTVDNIVKEMTEEQP